MGAAHHGPVYLLAGGHRKSDNSTRDLIRRLWSLDGLRSPTIAYIGSASDDSLSFFQWAQSIFIKAGAEEVRLLPTVAHFSLPSARALLEWASLIFINGGDVEAGMVVLQKRGLIPLLSNRFKAGIPFMGLSAGSIMLAEQWIRWSDPDDNSTAELFPCLGFAPLICDVHAEEDDWEELKMLLTLSSDKTVGYGLHADAALRISPIHTPHAVGAAVCRFRSDQGKIRKLTDLPAE